MKKLFILTILLLGSGILSGAITLVKNNTPQAVIVLDKKPTAASQLGALELQHALKAMTKAKLPILYGKAPKGGQAVIRIHADKKHDTGEYYEIKFKNNEIILAGHDSDTYQKVSYNDVKTFPSFKYQYNGSLFAVYDFLENQCGVRFFSLGELGTVYPKCNDLVVKEKNQKTFPKLDAFRYINIDDPSSYRNKYSKRDIALWRLRWRQTSFFGRTNHNQYSIYFAHWDKGRRPKFGKAFKCKRPELFAKGYTGKNAGVDPILRSNYPGDKDIPPQLCYSNQDTVKYYTDEVMTYYRGGNVLGGWHNFGCNYKPSKTLIPRLKGKMFFYPIQGGDTGGYCLCEKCKGRFPSDSQENISNNKFQFIADVANEVSKQAPDAGISTLAYISTMDYPDKVKLPENVSVQVCLTNYAWWHPTAYKFQHGVYKKWVADAKKRPITLWTYIFSTYWDANKHFGHYKPFPGFYPWVIGKQFKEFTADGIRGWFTEVELRYNMLEAYVANRIAFDPSLNPDNVIDDYFKKYYGAAGKPMKEFYKEVEKAFFNPANVPEKWLKNPKKFIGPKGVKHPYWGTGLNSPWINWGVCGTPERMAKLKSLLAQAEKLASTDEEKARLDDFKQSIWNDVLQGEKEWRILEKRLKQPPLLLNPGAPQNADGNLDKVDWNKAVTTTPWVSLNGEDIKSTSRMALAYDNKYLYLRYNDALKPKPERNIWRENIELFFTNSAHNPVWQFSVAPGGSVSGFKYLKSADKYKNNSYDFKAKVRNIPTQNGWEAQIAIPLAALDMKKLNPMILNFIRTRKEGTAIWSPIFCGAYLDGITNFGRLAFFPRRFEAKDFRYHAKGKCSGIIKDSAAFNKNVGWMMGDKGWSLQCPIPYYCSARYKYDIKIALRTELGGTLPAKFSIGIYNAKKRKVVGARSFSAQNVKGKKFKILNVGTYKLSPDMFIYIGGINPKNPANKIFVDYIDIKLVK
jgi:hypothetical protein